MEGRVARMSSRWNDTARLLVQCRCPLIHGNTRSAAGLNLPIAVVRPPSLIRRDPCVAAGSLMRHPGYHPTDDGNWREALLLLAFWDVHDQIGQS